MATSAATEKLVGKVAAEATLELLASLAQGAQQAQELLATAEREVVAEVRRILETATREEEMLRRRSIEGAELEARNRSLQLMEEAVTHVFETALQKLRGVMGGTGYERALKALAEEGAELIGSRDIVLAGNARDAKTLTKLAAQLAKERKLKVEIDPQPLAAVGGVQVRSRDGATIYNNTMEARLARLKPVLRKRVAELFTKEG